MQENSPLPGVVEDWRQLFPSLPVARPTYEPDLVGPPGRCDERDNVFARRDLVAGSERYRSYYALHPERRAGDDELRTLPPMGSQEAPANGEMFRAIFGSAMLMGHPSVVEGQLTPTPPPTPGEPVALPPAEAAAKVKGLALLLGADVVGIGPLNPAYVYTHVGRTFYGQTWGEEIHLDHPYAISLGVKMNAAGLVRSAPGFPTLLESGLAYARGALMAVQLAAYLRGLGYRARAHHLRNYQVLPVPVAVDGGLGELGRCGFLINRELGNCLRLSTVTTDLPLDLDPPVDMGVQRFCQRCTACARECPAGAIPLGEKTETRGVRKWAMDADACYRYWHQVGSDCALCMVVCPWSRWTLGPRPGQTEPPVAGSHYRPAPRPRWLL